MTVFFFFWVAGNGRKPPATTASPATKFKFWIFFFLFNYRGRLDIRRLEPASFHRDAGHRDELDIAGSMEGRLEPPIEPAMWKALVQRKIYFKIVTDKMKKKKNNIK